MLNPTSAEDPRVPLRHRTHLALVALAIFALAATAAGCTSSPATKNSATTTTVDAAAMCTTWGSVVSAFTALANGHLSSPANAHLSKALKTTARNDIRALQHADKSFRPTITKDIKEKLKDLQTSLKTLATDLRKKGATTSLGAGRGHPGERQLERSRGQRGLELSVGDGNHRRSVTVSGLSGGRENLLGGEPGATRSTPVRAAAPDVRLGRYELTVIAVGDEAIPLATTTRVLARFLRLLEA